MREAGEKRRKDKWGGGVIHWHLFTELSDWLTYGTEISIMIALSIQVKLDILWQNGLKMKGKVVTHKVD